MFTIVVENFSHAHTSMMILNNCSISVLFFQCTYLKIPLIQQQQQEQQFNKKEEQIEKVELLDTLDKRAAAACLAEAGVATIYLLWVRRDVTAKIIALIDDDQVLAAVPVHKIQSFIMAILPRSTMARN